MPWARSLDQLCSGSGPVKIVKSWGAATRPGILVGPVTTPSSNDLGSEANDATGLARDLLGPTWARVHRIPLIKREIRESLAENALEILFSAAEVLVEGDRDLDRRFAVANRAYATVMATLELDSCAALLREPADAATAERVAELMRGNPSVRRRMIELARPELAKLLGAEPSELRIELLPVVRHDDARVLIDGDAVVSLRGAKARGRRALEVQG